jgi:hypothetical protein
MPILGIIASQDYNRVTNSYESISTVTVGSGGSATVTFSSIPATYTHLQIRAIARSEAALANSSWQVRFNSDTATNYSYHALFGEGTTASAENAVTSNTMYFGQVIGNTSTASAFSALVCDILDYKDTNKYTTIRTLTGFDANGSGRIFLSSANWRNTAAVSTITIISGGAVDIAEYSQFALYGIKGA